MEFVIKIKNYLIPTFNSFLDKLTGTYWPAYSEWLDQKFSGQNEFAVLTYATSFALFFFVLLYWISKSRDSF